MEFKVVFYVIVGVGYLIYNLYRKLNVPPQSQMDMDAGYESDEIEADVPDVKAPQYKSVEDLLREIKQQEQKLARPEQKVNVEKTREMESAANESKSPIPHAAEVVPVPESKPETLIGEIETGKHLDLIHLFDYDQKGSKRKGKSVMNLKQAIIYDAILKRPQF